MRLVTEDERGGHKTETEPMPATPQLRPISHPFDDNIDDHPEDFFLSPVQMYEYDDSLDDSDDDGEEVEWDAGITDFALFDNDRRRAQEHNEPLPSRWNDMLAQQASALQRAQQRSRSYSEPGPIQPPLPMSPDDVPALTPDSSPNLRDDFDVDSAHEQPAFRTAVPNYLTVIVTPPDSGDGEIDDEDELPLSFHVAAKQPHVAPNRRLQRPGLRHSRTMSGKVHVWRRPSFNIYTVGEDADAERRAELGANRRLSEEGTGSSDYA